MVLPEVAAVSSVSWKLYFQNAAALMLLQDLGVPGIGTCIGEENA